MKEKPNSSNLSQLMTPCYDVTISGKECFIKLEWDVRDHLDKFCIVEFPFQIAFKQDKNIDR